ncbi:hypothetical protein [Puia dinghuensis]|nr:hypothetical protein [Puia dinghuensis]
MTFEQFKATLNHDQPPTGIPPVLTALWYAQKDNWNKAHDIAQDIPTREGSWVHAYLHRVEGDEGNAHYWYTQAGRQLPELTPEQEWEQLVTSLLVAG